MLRKANTLNPVYINLSYMGSVPLLVELIRYRRKRSTMKMAKALFN